MEFVRSTSKICTSIIILAFLHMSSILQTLGSTASCTSAASTPLSHSLSSSSMASLYLPRQMRGWRNTWTMSWRRWRVCHCKIVLSFGFWNRWNCWYLFKFIYCNDFKFYINLNNVKESWCMVIMLTNYFCKL